MSAISTPESHHRELAGLFSDALLYGTFTVLLFGPLAFGAVEPWSIFIVEAVSAGLLLLWAAKQFLHGEIKIKPNDLFPPMGMFGLLIASQLAFRITSYPHDTISLALIYISYGILCFIVTQSLSRSSQVRSLALIFSVYGAVLAAFALIQGISSNGKLYWIREPHMGGWIYGPYVNHNHYAGLMEMLVPIPLVISLTNFTSRRNRNLAAVAAAVMAGTVFLSGSRGGMLAMICELVLLAVFLAKQKRGIRTAVALGLFLVIVAGLLSWIGGSELSRRIATVGASHSELSSDIRTYINRDALRMFLKKPILGWGLGTFPVIYPQFRTFYTNFFVNEAHDDYLQLLVETGFVGFAAMIWFLVIVYRNAMRKIKDWSSDIGGAASLACLLGLSGILVHSAFDFNLQIPANAALFYVLCTVAASEPFARPALKRRMVPTKRADEFSHPQEALVQPATNF
jgi:O-antigen ligase